MRRGRFPLVTRTLLALLALVGLGLASTSGVSAHAYLESSTPAAGAALSQAPQQLRLTFTEALDASFSNVQVLDSRRQQVDKGDSQIAPDDPRSMTVSMGSVPDGLYTVVWRTLSAVDGHSVNGAFPIFIGIAPTAVATTATSDVEFSPETALARWWLYVAASLVFGALVSWRLVFSPLLSGTNAGARPEVMRRVRWIALIGAILLVLGALYAALAQAASAGGVPFWEALGQPLQNVLARGRYAAIWWPRFGLSLAVLVLIAWRGLEGTAGDVALAATPAILLTSSLTSHGAALLSGPYVGIASDWLHFIGAAVWLGGLTTMVFALPLAITASARNGERVFARAVSRFSNLALISVVVIGATGTFQAWLEIGSWAGLFGTNYGQSVLVKVALMLVMVAAGGYNLLVIRPRLEAATAGGLPGPGPSKPSLLDRLSARAEAWLPSISPERMLPSFRRSIRLELALGVLVLMVAAVLTGLAPGREQIARQASGDNAPGPVNRRIETGGLAVQVGITPASIGENTLSVQIPGVDPSSVERAQLTLTYLDSELGAQPVVLDPVPEALGTWQSVTPFLSQPGQWQADLLVRRTGQDDLRGSLRFQVSGPGAAAAQTSTATANYPLLPSPVVALSYVLVAAGLVVCVVGIVRRGRRRQRNTRAAVVAAGLLVIACGGYVYAREQTDGIPLDVANVRNPVPPDDRSIAAGQQIYTTYCETCHGETGRGDGPTGLRLVPRPADLQVHMAPGVHKDGELFFWISYGYPKSAMPAWASTLTEQERWDVINYARTLVPQQ